MDQIEWGVEFETNLILFNKKGFDRQVIKKEPHMIITTENLYIEELQDKDDEDDEDKPNLLNLESQLGVFTGSDMTLFNESVERLDSILSTIHNNNIVEYDARRKSKTKHKFKRVKKFNVFSYEITTSKQILQSIHRILVLSILDEKINFKIQMVPKNKLKNQDIFTMVSELNDEMNLDDLLKVLNSYQLTLKQLLSYDLSFSETKPLLVLILDDLRDKIDNFSIEDDSIDTFITASIDRYTEHFYELLKMILIECDDFISSNQSIPELKTMVLELTSAQSDKYKFLHIIRSLLKENKIHISNMIPLEFNKYDIYIYEKQAGSIRKKEQKNIPFIYYTNDIDSEPEGVPQFTVTFPLHKVPRFFQLLGLYADESERNNHQFIYNYANLLCFNTNERVEGFILYLVYYLCVYFYYDDLSNDKTLVVDYFKAYFTYKPRINPKQLYEKLDIESKNHLSTIYQKLKERSLVKINFIWEYGYNDNYQEISELIDEFRDRFTDDLDEDEDEYPVVLDEYAVYRWHKNKQQQFEKENEMEPEIMNMFIEDKKKYDRMLYDKHLLKLLDMVFDSGTCIYINKIRQFNGFYKVHEEKTKFL